MAFSLLNVALAAGCPLAGRLADRFGSRKVILLSTVGFGSILIFSVVLVNKIWVVYVFYVVLGLVSSGAVIIYSKVISHWFDRRRGLALGLMTCGFGTGAIMMPPLEQHLVALWGWRAAYALLGAGVLSVAVPTVGAFLKDRPEEMGLLPDGRSDVRSVLTQGRGDSGLSPSESSHTRTFWVMFCAFCLASASVHAGFVHMPALLADRGASARAAALASSVLGAGMLVVRLVAGYLFDRFFAPHVAMFFFGGLSFGIGLLSLTHSPEVAFPAAFLVGLGLGAEGDIIAYLTSRYFGLRSFGEVYAYNYAGFILAGAVGSYVMGAGFDRTDSYAAPLALFFVAALLAMLLMTRLGPYRYSASQSLANE